VRPGIASFSGTVKFVPAVASARDFHAMAIEFFLAKNTNALIVERLPGPELIAGTQDGQSIFGFEVGAHCAVKMSVAQVAGLHNRGDG
jgi:hypothetical protein